MRHRSTITFILVLAAGLAIGAGLRAQESKPQAAPPDTSPPADSRDKKAPTFRPKNSLPCEFLGPCGKCDCSEPLDRGPGAAKPMR